MAIFFGTCTLSETKTKDDFRIYAVLVFEQDDVRVLDKDSGCADFVAN